MCSACTATPNDLLLQVASGIKIERLDLAHDHVYSVTVIVKVDTQDSVPGKRHPTYTCSERDRSSIREQHISGDTRYRAEFSVY